MNPKLVDIYGAEAAYEQFSKTFHEGVDAFIKGDWPTAWQKLEGAPEFCPQDTPTMLLMKEMRARSIDPNQPVAPVDWKGYRRVELVDGNESQAGLAAACSRRDEQARRAAWTARPGVEVRRDGTMCQVERPWALPRARASLRRVLRVCAYYNMCVNETRTGTAGTWAGVCCARGVGSSAGVESAMLAATASSAA